jgi:hypothetical protein
MAACASTGLGFKLHPGWAVVVAIAGVPAKFEVILRRRVELLPPGDSVPRFVYHKAAELPAPQAAELIQRAKVASHEAARIALRDVLDHLRPLYLVAAAAGIPRASKTVPKDLAIVLRSHPLIHTAESALFRQAVTSACEDYEVAVVSVREREVWPSAATAWGLKESGLRKQVDDLRKSTGAPWGADQKTAAAMALLALRSNR